MTNLGFGEVWRNVVLLHMADPTVTKRVHTAAWNFQAVADRI